MMTSWEVNDFMVEHLLDSMMNVLRDKEINDKKAAFSVVSTMATIKSAINFKDFQHDNRKDDKYISAKDGDEVAPPLADNISMLAKVNDPKMMAKFKSKRVANMVDAFGGHFSPTRQLLGTNGRTSGMSQKSRHSNRSQSRLSETRRSIHVGSDNGQSIAVTQESTQGKRKTSKRSESARRQRMEKKLQAYYNSLIKPVDEWGPYYPIQDMLDGTDVDAQINKKRAHKTIMAEAFNPKNRFRMKAKSKSSLKKSGGAKQDVTGNGNEPPDSAFEEFLADSEVGYIIDNGNMILIEAPKIESVSKFAFDVIKV